MLNGEGRRERERKGEDWDEKREVLTERVRERERRREMWRALARISRGYKQMRETDIKIMLIQESLREWEEERDRDRERERNERE